MDNNIKVSIIVPVYNVPEKALRDCLESTINQTMKEIEVLVIDDGSTDDSGKICDEYAAKDDRLHVIHKKNGGLSAARNTGYEAAKGEWITFLDSDDWIEPNTCEETYELGKKQDVDIVIFGTIQEFKHYKNPFKYHFADGTIFQGKECKRLLREILDFNGNVATAWAKLIRKIVLDENYVEHNEELKQGSEGIEFNIRLFEKIESAYFTDKIFYHYIYNPNSISAKHNEKNHYYVIRCFEEIEKHIRESEDKDIMLEMLYGRFSYVLVAAAISGYFSPENRQKYSEKKASFKKYIRNEFVDKVIKEGDRQGIDIPRKLILLLIQLKCYLIIALIAKVRYRQKH